MYSGSIVGAPFPQQGPGPFLQWTGQQQPVPFQQQSIRGPFPQQNVVVNSFQQPPMVLNQPPRQIFPQVVQSPQPQLYSSRATLVSSPPQQPLQPNGLGIPPQFAQQQNIPPNFQSSQLLQSQRIPSSGSQSRLTSKPPLEKPVVIINSDMSKRFQSSSQSQEQEPIIDTTDKELIESLDAKIERLQKIETALNSTISQKSSASASKETLIQQLKEQRGKLDDMNRIQSIRQSELQGSIKQTRQDLDQMNSIQADGEEEIERLKALLEEKNRIVNKWKTRGSEAERLSSDLSLLQQQFSQLQAQNQVLRNNIKLDPSYNYLII